MPELPEVELAARRLTAGLVGRRIDAVQLVDAKLLANSPPGALAELKGATVECVERRGKYLLLFLAGGPLMLVHLRMTGRFIFAKSPSEAPAHPIRCVFLLAGGGAAIFRDPRRFARFELLPPGAAEGSSALAALGPDALLEPPSAERLSSLAAGRRQSIKALLMDQRRLAGLGNICAIEILYRAGIAPHRAAGELTTSEIRRISELVPAYLEWAIDRQARRDIVYLGERGAENVFTIYRRAGERCPRCGSVIARARIAGRGTYWCPGCQR